MKIVNSTILAVSLAFTTALAVQAQDAPAAKTAEEAAKEANTLMAAIPDPAATYGKDGKITAAEVKDMLRPQLENAIMNGASIQQEQLLMVAHRFTEGMLNIKLLQTEATAKGFLKDLEKGKNELNSIKERAGEEQFKKMLGDSNLTEEEAVDKLAEIAQINALMDSLNKVDEKDAKDFYDKNPAFFKVLNAAHILAKFPDNPTQEDKDKALEKIKASQKKMADGKSFADVAKEDSDCPSSGNGGDLGDFQEGQMVPDFEAALKKLKPGEISAPVETQFGYHLIKAGESKIIPFEEAKDNILASLKQQNIRKLEDELLEKLRKDADVKNLIPMPKQEEK